MRERLSTRTRTGHVLFYLSPFHEKQYIIRQRRRVRVEERHIQIQKYIEEKKLTDPNDLCIFQQLLQRLVTHLFVAGLFIVAYFLLAHAEAEVRLSVQISSILVLFLNLRSGLVWVHKLAR